MNDLFLPLLLFIHIHVNDAAIARARALKGVAIAFKTRVFIQKRRDSGLVLGSKIKLKIIQLSST